MTVSANAGIRERRTAKNSPETAATLPLLVSKRRSRSS
jgi:hypothetical protein